MRERCDFMVILPIVHLARPGDGTKSSVEAKPFGSFGLEVVICSIGRKKWRLRNAHFFSMRSKTADDGRLWEMFHGAASENGRAKGYMNDEENRII